jgi:hypothetical protein
MIIGHSISVGSHKPGLNLGAEKNSYPDFSNSSGWTLRTGHTISGNKFNIACAGSQFSNKTLSLSAGHTYQIAYNIDILSAGAVSVNIGADPVEWKSIAGTYYKNHTATADGTLYIQSNGATTGSLILTSVKEIL